MAGGGIKQNNITVRGGADGATFTPSVDAQGDLSWTNNKGYKNPPTKNIKGPQGEKGERGDKGDKGDSGKPLTIVGVISNTSLLPIPTEQNRYQAYLVGTQSPYVLYVVVGKEGGSLEWVSQSNFNINIKKYYYHNITINVINNTNIKQFWMSFITSNQNPITIINSTNFPYRPFVRVGIIYEGASGYAYKPITLFSDTTGSRFTIFSPSGLITVSWSNCSISSDIVVEV